MSGHEENTITDDERKAAEKLSNSFMSEKRNVGPEQLRKITQAGLTILATAGNRFVRGFDESGAKDIRDGNIMPYAPDVVQWREVCRANRDTLREWLCDADAFRNHWQDVMLDMSADMEQIGQMFGDVFEAYLEIIENQVEAKPEKAKGPKSAPAKKKARSRAKKRNTPSP